MRIIFLDLDGVLVTIRSHFANLRLGGLMVDYDELGAKFLCNFCNKHAYRIVISSCWRSDVPRLYTLLRQSGLIDWIYNPENVRESCTKKLDKARGELSDLNEKENKEAGNNLRPHGRSLEILEWILNAKNRELNEHSLELHPTMFNTICDTYDQDSFIAIDDDVYDVEYLDSLNHFKFIHCSTPVGISADNMSDMIKFANDKAYNEN